MANERMEYLYSKLSGFSIYAVPAGELDAAGTAGTLTLTDIRSRGERKYRAFAAGTRKEESSAARAVWLAGIIQNPVPGLSFDWPLDYIEAERPEGVVGWLVYRGTEHRRLKPIRELLYQPGMSRVLDWRNPFIITVSRNLLTAVAALHANGFIYNDFSIHDILYHPDTGEVLLKFHRSIRKSGSRTPYDTVDCTDISPEFAPPYVYDSGAYDGFLSRATDGFQMTALLFRLMVGRLPYEGRDLMSYGTVFDPEFDTDENAHKYYFQHYHQYPHFVFDENDETNALSATSDNDLPRERWGALPEDVQRAFQRSLCQAAAEHPSAEYAPAEWLEIVARLEKLGWKA